MPSAARRVTRRKRMRTASRIRGPLRWAGEDQARIGAAEAERIRQRRPHLAMLRLLRHQVYVAAFGRIVEVEGGRNHLIADRQDREDRLDRTRSTQQMTDGRFGGGHGKLIGPVPE